MKEKEIMFKIWCTNQDIMHLGDIYDRCKDDEHKNNIAKHIKELEEQKIALLSLLK